MGLSMNIIDRADLIGRVRRGDAISLELGCGARKRNRTAIGIDQLDLPEVDVVGDVFDVLSLLPQGSVMSIHTYHFLEHVSDLSRIMPELGRVLKPGGELEVAVPHFANPYYYSDPTHCRPFGLYTFCYLAKSSLFARTVPAYGYQFDFDLRDVRLHFDSPFISRKIIRRLLLNPFFNLTRWMQEFHEENLCFLFPAYEICYKLVRTTQ